ncbi:MAG: hypothetical protein H6860_02300 [Rhodospirillales bacterium]|nr:hypothetical protein [Rhodospirillales bacterium]
MKSIEAGAQVRLRALRCRGYFRSVDRALYDRKEQRGGDWKRHKFFRIGRARKALMEEVHKTDDMTTMDKICREHPELFALMNGYSGEGR